MSSQYGRTYCDCIIISGPVKCIQMTGNVVLSGSEDASMKMFDLNSGKAVHSFLGHVWGVACLQFNDDYIVSGSRDRRVFLWDRRLISNRLNNTGSSSGKSTKFPEVSTRACVRAMEGHTNTVRCVAFDSSTIVSGSWDNKIKIWNLETGELKNTLEGHDSRVLCLAFDEKKIVSGSVDKTIRVWWHYEGGVSKRRPYCYSMQQHTAPIFYLNYDDYGISSGSRDTEIVRWDFYSVNEDDVKRTKRYVKF